MTTNAKELFESGLEVKFDHQKNEVRAFPLWQLQDFERAVRVETFRSSAKLLCDDNGVTTWNDCANILYLEADKLESQQRT